MTNDNCRKFKENQIMFLIHPWIVEFSRPIVFRVDRLRERGSLPVTFYVLTRVFPCLLYTSGELVSLSLEVVPFGWRCGGESWPISLRCFFTSLLNLATAWLAIIGDIHIFLNLVSARVGWHKRVFEVTFSPLSLSEDNNFFFKILKKICKLISLISSIYCYVSRVRMV